MEDGNVVEACNAAWDALIPTGGNWFDEIFRRKTMTPMLICRCVHEDVVLVHDCDCGAA